MTVWEELYTMLLYEITIYTIYTIYTLCTLCTLCTLRFTCKEHNSKLFTSFKSTSYLDLTDPYLYVKLYAHVC
jgi:hypothetical protein